MDKQTYAQLDRIELKLNVLMDIEGIQLDPYGNPLPPEQQPKDEKLQYKKEE